MALQAHQGSCQLAQKLNSYNWILFIFQIQIKQNKVSLIRVKKKNSPRIASWIWNLLMGESRIFQTYAGSWKGNEIK